MTTTTVVPIRRLLIANRGEIACRIIHTARAMGIHCIAVFSEADRHARHVQMADQAICIGPAPASESYLSIAAMINACAQTEADAVHPGYGFLSENAEFAQACADANICFVGPSANAMRALGNKASAKEIAQGAGINVARGYTGSVQSSDTVVQEATRIGYPLMVKAAAGGGGRGMRLVEEPGELIEAISSAQRESLSSFGSDQIFLERAVLNARHIEIQILADQHGNVYSLGERDCSTQRKNQKIIEEAPAPGFSAATRQILSDAAIQLTRATGYYGAATVEFLVDPTDSASAFYFLEVNTRLQVEHPVTEALLGLDLVELQLRIAQGERLELNQQLLNQQMLSAGHAIELRLCAEDPSAQFAPQAGLFSLRGFDQTSQFKASPLVSSYLRVDSGLNSTGEISPWYDSMCAKLISVAPTRELAIVQMRATLNAIQIAGLQTNQHYLLALLQSQPFVSAQLHTRWLDQFNQSASVSYAQSTLNELSSLSLQAAALFGHRSSAQHGLLQGFASLSSTIYVESNGVISKVNVQCVKPYLFDCQLATESLQNTTDRKVSIDVRQLNPTWFGQSVWLPTQTGSANLNINRFVSGLLFKLRPFAVNSKASTEQSVGEVFSTMHGKVSQLLVNPGSKVKKGDVLACVEAMKMEHPYVAKIDGVVAQVLTHEGQQVSPGQLLLRLTTDDSKTRTN